MAYAGFFEYSSAVRGYHYRKYWQHQAIQKLECVHEKDNPYNFFAINSVDTTSGIAVAHLSMENSRVTKFLLDLEARVFAILTSPNYCISPLVQGGLEIPCRFEIHMAPIVRNKELIRIYESCIYALHYEREGANIIGSFESEEVSDRVQSESRKRKKNKNEARKNEKQQGTKHIRSFLVKVGTTKSCSNKRGQIDTTDVVELSDWLCFNISNVQKINCFNFFFPKLYLSDFAWPGCKCCFIRIRYSLPKYDIFCGRSKNLNFAEFIFSDDQKIMFCGINFCVSSKAAAFCGIYFCVLRPNLQKLIPR